MRKLYKLGPLLLDPQSRVLTHDGAAVPVGARGVAVLTALVSQPNEYVEKSAILDAAWPGLVVEEANLAVQISAIRRALGRVPGGESWVETLPRRGYRFVGPVAETDGRSAPPVALDRKRSNLPELLTSFVGREREMAEIKQLLPSSRLLTFTGTGGIGKTRLAQQAAAEVLDAYRDGVRFVDLAPLVDPTLVPSTLARVLGVKESGAQPLVDLLCAHLRAKELLLVLDNCEQVLDSCARLAEALLRETTHVTILATSREALHLGAEHVYPVAALPLPDLKASAQSIARSDAVQLFVERARQQRPRFDLQEERARAVAEICVRLDGIPLALELAAARVAVLPAEQIARRLDQRFRLLTRGREDSPRHQTLRGMIDWSYELLDEAEKALFARLSVFAGGWTLAAAEAICGGEPIGKDDLVYVLIGLIEQSLAVVDEGGERYRMLETMREYARDKLVAVGAADTLRQRHRDYFLALAEESYARLNGSEQAVWLERLDEDHDNLRSALQWSLFDAEPKAGLQLCRDLWRFWWLRGHFAEGREWCARLLAKAGADSRTLYRANALNAAGVLAYCQGAYPAAKAQFEDCLTIMRELGHQSGVASALSNVGMIVWYQGDVLRARKLYAEALAIWRELGAASEIGLTLLNLGSVDAEEGNYQAARARYTESLQIYRELGQPWGIAHVLMNLGEVAGYAGDFPEARALCEESVSIRRKLGEPRGIASSLRALGEVACEQGDLACARRALREALQVQHDLGDRRGIFQSLWTLAATIAGPDAARVWGAAERLREEIGSPLFPIERSRHDRRVRAARACFRDDAAFDRAWQEGRSLMLAEGIDLALDESKAMATSASVAPDL